MSENVLRGIYEVFNKYENGLATSDEFRASVLYLFMKNKHQEKEVEK